MADLDAWVEIVASEKIVRLNMKNEEMRLDVERYRWLIKMWPKEIMRLLVSHLTYEPTSKEVDSTIDECIRRNNG